MILLSKCLGVPVVVKDGGELVGNIENVYFDRSRLVFAYFRIVSAANEALLLPLGEGEPKDVLLIPSASILRRESDEDLSKMTTSLLGMTAFTLSGRGKGGVLDARFTSAGKLIGLSLSCGEISPSQIECVGDVLLLRSCRQAPSKKLPHPKNDYPVQLLADGDPQTSDDSARRINRVDSENALPSSAQDRAYDDQNSADDTHYSADDRGHCSHSILKAGDSQHSVDVGSMADDVHDRSGADQSFEYGKHSSAGDARSSSSEMHNSTDKTCVCTDKILNSEDNTCFPTNEVPHSESDMLDEKRAQSDDVSRAADGQHTQNIMPTQQSAAAGQQTQDTAKFFPLFPSPAISLGTGEPMFSQGALNAVLDGGELAVLADDDRHTPTRVICDYEFLLGRTLGSDLRTYADELLAPKGSVITPALVELARAHGKLVDLTLSSVKKQ